jgi:N-acetylneuraminic acid mutarotase
MFNVFNPSRTENPLATLEMAERWHEYSALPEARSGLTTVLYDGDVYAIGGQSAAGVSGNVFRYTTTEGMWESLGNKPTPVMDMDGVLIGERIFVAGGITQSLSLTDVLEVFNPRNDTWEVGRPLPEPISNYAAIAYQGELILFGGWNGIQALDTVWIYNPESQMWRKGSPMMNNRMGANVVEVGGKLYLFGGTDGNHQVSAIEVFNPSRDSTGEIAWTVEGRLPDDVVILGVEELAEFVFAVGQLDGETFTVMNYDVNSSTWQSLYKGTSHTLYSDMGLCTLGGDIILLGGTNDQDEIQDDHWHFTAVYTISIPIISQ